MIRYVMSSSGCDCLKLNETRNLNIALTLAAAPMLVGRHAQNILRFFLFDGSGES